MSLFKTFVCVQCAAVFEHASSLWSHVRTVHQRDRYACRPCKAQFSTRGRLQHHLEGSPDCQEEVSFSEMKRKLGALESLTLILGFGFNEFFCEFYFNFFEILNNFADMKKS